MRLRRTKHFLSLATKANIFGVKIIESWKWRGIAWIKNNGQKNNTETQSTAHEKEVDDDEAEEAASEKKGKELNLSAKQEHTTTKSRKRSKRCWLLTLNKLCVIRVIPCLQLASLSAAAAAAAVVFIAVAFSFSFFAYSLIQNIKINQVN